MSRAEERASEAYPKETRDCAGFVVDIGHPQWIRNYYIQGYEQAEKDTVDRAAEWWYDHIVGFMKEGLAKNVIEEFREAMAGRERKSDQKI